MARVTDDVIQAIYDLLKQPFPYAVSENVTEDRVHPDPVGFLARSDVLSNLDQSFRGENGEVGICAVPPKRLSSLGRDGTDIDDNVRAAIETDLRHYFFVNRDGLQDIDLMHAAWFVGPSKARNPDKETKDLMAKIREKRESIRQIVEPEDVGQDAEDLVKAVSGEQFYTEGQTGVNNQLLDEFALPERPIIITEEGKSYRSDTAAEQRINLYAQVLREKLQ